MPNITTNHAITSTNHSLRATAVSRLFQNNVDDKLIKGVTGHRSDALQGCKRETEEQLLKVSKIVQGQCFTQQEHEVIIYGIMTYCSTSVTTIMTCCSIPLSNKILLLILCEARNLQQQ